MLSQVMWALMKIDGLPGVTVSEVRGFGKGPVEEAPQKFIDGAVVYALKVKLEIMLPDAMVDVVVDSIEQAACTGRIGDGKIFVKDLQQVVKIRTGERGESAL
jgi:nitrogen regulatory protein PII